MTDELVDKLEWGCRATLEQLSTQCATEPPYRPYAHLISVWRPVHLLAMRDVREAQAARSRANHSVSYCELLWVYVDAVRQLNRAVQNAADRENLTLRDIRTGARITDWDRPDVGVFTIEHIRGDVVPIGSWERPNFDLADEWDDALRVKKDKWLAYEILHQWQGAYIHYGVGVAVDRAQITQWVKSEKGLGCSADEVDRCFAGIVPAAQVQSSTLAADPANASPASAHNPHTYREKVREVVKKHGGNKTAAARELGITPQRVGQLVNEPATKEAAATPQHLFPGTKNKN